MSTTTTTGTLAAGESRTFTLAPGAAVSLTLSPNPRVTITETPENVSGSGVGGNTTRVHEPQLPGTFAYGPYVMGGVVVVAVASNSGSSVAWTRKDTVVTTSSDGTSLVSGDGDEFGAINSNGTADPLTSPVAVVGAAGALTGAYYYAFTYVTPAGETGPVTGTATVVNPSSQRVEVSGITVCPDSSCTARKLYRTPAVTGTVDPKDYKLVATIADNTTTTYSDNTADGSLGADAPWISQTQGQLLLAGAKVANFTGQSVGIGVGALATYKGYACTAVGYNALNVVTTGKRNTAVGVYALEDVTTGYENTAIGTHAGGAITAGARNTMLGYQAGGATSSATDFNVAVGYSAFLGSGASKGSGNTAIGYRALADINTADYCVALGFAAGKYANASRMLFIDNADRGSLANCQNIGIVYGKMESTAIAQVLHINALTRIGPPSVTVSTLPAATGLAGFRAFVTDANATTFAGIVAGGGSNGVPVYCDGTNWRIG